MRILLLPISLVYHIILIIRHKLYDWRFLKRLQFGKPVICVGNLNLGGTGKTPTVEYLISLLKERYQVATLSRGYGRKTKGFQTADSNSTYMTLGDEPMQYFTKYPKVQVAVDEDRVNGVKQLFHGNHIPDVILLDDAFQHRRIQAGLNILLTDYQRLYTDDFLFPAGGLRDVKSAAKRADLIVVSKSPDNIDEAKKNEIVAKLKPEFHQKVFFSWLEYQCLKPLNEAARDFTFEDADSALAFCGIANPTPFASESQRRFKTVDILFFPDHHAYTDNDVRTITKRFERLVGKQKIIVTTEKDAARLANSPYLCQLEKVPLYVLPINVRFYEEEKFNKVILDYVRKDSQND